MKIDLRSFTKNDLELHEQWCADINADQFMSRCEPVVYTQTGMLQTYLSVWYLILVDEQPAGSIWFEKEVVDDPFVTLGIMLGNPAYFGKGIGSKAIEIGIKTAANRLEFSSIKLNVRKTNSLAIACYQKSGFVTINEGINEKDGSEPIPYFEMEYKLQ